MDTSVIIMTISSPVLITIGGIISWYIKTRKEELRLVEERAREKRIKTYEILLEPFVAALTSTLDEKRKQKEVDKIGTLEYRKAGFNLVTFGSDEMVRTYNDLMQHFYKTDNPAENNQQKVIQTLKYFSAFILAIRKDLNDRKTDLKISETIEFMVTDMDKYRNQLDE